MANPSDSIKARNILLDRALALKQEGYSFVVLTSTDQMFFAKMKHNCNGRYIIIKGYPRENVFSQTSNGYPVITDAPIICKSV